MTRVLAALVLVAAATAAVAACGNDDPSAGIPATPEAADAPDPRLRVRLQARADSTDPWAETVRARPGQLVRFRMLIRNLGEAASSARARLALDRGLRLVGISAYLRRDNDTRSGGTPLKPGLTRQGVVLGELRPGTARLVFSLRVASRADVGGRLTVGASLRAHARRAADTAVVRVARR